jgi:DNA-binding response OmpR family regulator
MRYASAAWHRITNEEETAVNASRILIAEDERLVADTLKQIFDVNGFSATLAYNKKSALELASLSPPDVVLSNVFLGDGTGIELARELCQISPHCKVLLISGQTDTSDLLLEAEQQGEHFQVVAKPVSPAYLLQRVRDLIDEDNIAA